MTTEGPYDDDPFMTEIRDFFDNFEARGWEGLDYRDPTNSGHGDWEGFVVKKNEPTAWNPRDGRRLCEVPDHPRASEDREGRPCSERLGCSGGRKVRTRSTGVVPVSGQDAD